MLSSPSAVEAGPYHNSDKGRVGWFFSRALWANQRYYVRLTYLLGHSLAGIPACFSSPQANPRSTGDNLLGPDYRQIFHHPRTAVLMSHPAEMEQWDHTFTQANRLIQNRATHTARELATTHAVFRHFKATSIQHITYWVGFPKVLRYCQLHSLVHFLLFLSLLCLKGHMGPIQLWKFHLVHPCDSAHVLLHFGAALGFLILGFYWHYRDHWRFHLHILLLGWLLMFM